MLCCTLVVECQSVEQSTALLKTAAEELVTVYIVSLLFNLMCFIISVSYKRY
jgi:hypothetical protein